MTIQSLDDTITVPMTHIDVTVLGLLVDAIDAISSGIPISTIEGYLTVMVYLRDASSEADIWLARQAYLHPHEMRSKMYRIPPSDEYRLAHARAQVRQAPYSDELEIVLRIMRKSETYTRLYHTQDKEST